MTRRGLGAVLCLCVACHTAKAAAPQGAPGPAEKPALTLNAVRRKLPFSLNGFFETRAGFRTQNDRTQSKDHTIGEARLQLELGKALERAEFKVKGDLYYDSVLETGEGDLREANVLLTPVGFADVKIGRQVLTWGTGDLVFINDLFPKDWASFFIGRDDEYLKAPSDAVKASLFSPAANLDVVYTPRFNPDHYVTGERLSYWNSTLGRRAGEDERMHDEGRGDTWRDCEIAGRLSRNVRGTELALYGYYGFWKTPEGLNPDNGKAFFPRLAVYGASARGAVLGGIGNAEMGYYDSRQDLGGSDLLVRNSELRLLVGYKRELAKDFTGAVQYYVERMMDYGDYKRRLSSAARPTRRDEDRHLVTFRLTKLLMNQNLRLSLFTYYSPSDKDTYLRPKIHYKFSDHLSGEIGANVFVGEDEHSFFGQLEKNTNVYAGLRWAF